MKNLQLTKLGFLLFLVLLCGCSDSFVTDTPAEAGNSYESDVHVLNNRVRSITLIRTRKAPFCLTSRIPTLKN